MEKLIKRQLELENSKKVKDKHLIETLEKIVSKGEITFEQWRQSGRFVRTIDFLRDYPSLELHSYCAQVIKYFGGVFVQVHSSGNFFIDYDDFSSSSLGDVEKLLWESCEKNLI
jgi:hypothetical protein